MTPSILHVLFTPSAAGTLRQVLKASGRDDRVISLFDNFSFGPIDPPDGNQRAQWVERELGWTHWGNVTSSDEFWQMALSAKYRKIAWVSRRSTMEYAGFLEWLWRLGEGSCEIIDVTELKVSCFSEHGPAAPAASVSVGILTPDQILENKVLDQSVALYSQQRTEHRRLWQKLRSENAPLRILEQNGLVSAPLDYFDALLVSFVTDQWQKVALVIGGALAAQFDNCLFQVGDLVLASRIDAIVELGQFEIRGSSALNMHQSEVRLHRV